MIRLICIAFFLFSASLCAASTITGYGCSNDPQLAAEYALEDIASQIATHVQSTLLTTRQVTESADTTFSYRRLKVSTDLVILGAKTQTDKDCVTATLSPASAPLYTEALRKLKEDIDKAWLAAEKADSDSLKKTYLEAALTAFANYQRYTVPAYMLNAEIPKPLCTESAINVLLQKMADVSADPAQIARNVMSQITVPVDVLSPELYGSYGVTAFSSLLKNEMDVLKKSGEALQKLRCVYSPNPENEHFILACSLTDSRNNVEKSILTNVSVKVCETVDCYLPPQIKQMEAIFQDGYGRLRGYFYTDYEEGALILSEGDIIRLYARMNAPAELLLMVLSADNKLYAVPMSGKIVKELNQSDAGRSVELSRLTVAPPYGTESLILFAYQGKLETLLPGYKTDGESGLYLFSEDPAKVLSRLHNLPKESYFEKKLIFTTREAD